MGVASTSKTSIPPPTSGNSISSSLYSYIKLYKVARFTNGIVSICSYASPVAATFATNVQNKVSQATGKEKYPICSKLSALKVSVPSSAFTETFS